MFAESIQRSILDEQGYYSHDKYSFDTQDNTRLEQIPMPKEKSFVSEKIPIDFLLLRDNWLFSDTALCNRSKLHCDFL